MADVQAALEKLRAQFGELETEEFHGYQLAVVPADKLVAVVKFLRDDPELSFEQCVDVTAVDWYDLIPRFQVFYQLLSLKNHTRLALRVPVAEGNAVVPSITALYPGVNWFEREAYDMFGITFDGHPDMRRILMPTTFRDFPLRKDFPLGYEDVAFSFNAEEIHQRKAFTPQGLEEAAKAKAKTGALIGAETPPPDKDSQDGYQTWVQPIDSTGGMRQHVGPTLDDVTGIGPLAEATPSDDPDDPFGGNMILNIGPHHPSTHGVLRLVTELNGERMVRLMPDIGFLHTGIEKTIESKSYLKALPCTDRTGYASPLHCNMAYSGTIEGILGVEVPPKAQWARVILLELDRISSHLLAVGSTAMDLGASSPFLWAVRDRERVYDIMEFTSGARMMTSYIRPGGLAYDLPQGFDHVVQTYVDYLPDQLDMIANVLINNPIFLERMQNVGVLRNEDVLPWNVSGPIARASGLDWDLRRDTPYLVYDKVQFDVPVYTSGDCYARFMIRLDEMRQSLGIIQQALDALPEGRWITADRKVAPPPKEEIAISMESLIHHFKIWTEGFRTPPGPYYFAIESPRGEMGFFIQSDGSAKPYRAHMRSAAFSNLQAMPLVCPGELISDLIPIIGTWDPIMGEIDR